MPNIGTQVMLKGGSVAWVSKITPDGSDDRVVFENGEEKRVDQMVDIMQIIGEEPPPFFMYVAQYEKPVSKV